MLEPDMPVRTDRRNPLDDYRNEVRLAAEDLRMMCRRFIGVALVNVSEHSLHHRALRAAKATRALR